LSVGAGAQAPPASKSITEAGCTAAKLGDSIPVSSSGEPASAVTLSPPFGSRPRKISLLTAASTERWRLSISHPTRDQWFRRPNMCSYPEYPKYNKGPATAAESFTCSAR
jgi:hypothetical protein